MVVAIGLDGVVQLAQEFEAVARQEEGASDAALLQAFFGIERLTQGFGVTGYEFAF